MVAAQEFLGLTSSLPTSVVTLVLYFILFYFIIINFFFEGGGVGQSVIG